MKVGPVLVFSSLVSPIARSVERGDANVGGVTKTEHSLTEDVLLVLYMVCLYFIKRQCYRIREEIARCVSARLKRKMVLRVCKGKC
jgi:hypothetical protein